MLWDETNSANVRQSAGTISGFSFQVCLLRSRSCRPPGCLRHATRPAPAGTCSGLKSQVCLLRSRSCRPPGWLRQCWLAFQPARLIRKFSQPAPPTELPFGSLSRPSQGLDSPCGLFIQPTAQPPCCLVPGQRPLARVQVSSTPPLPPLTLTFTFTFTFTFSSLMLAPHSPFS